MKDLLIRVLVAALVLGQPWPALAQAPGRFTTMTITSTASDALKVGTASVGGTDLAKIDGITNGTAAAGKALVADANVDILGMRNLSLSGTLFAAFTSISNTGLNILDSDSDAHLVVIPGSDLTVNRSLTLTTGDADRTITLSGNPTLADWFDQSVKTTASPTFSAPTVTSMTFGATSISETDIAKVDGITNGTAAANKALVVDASLDISGLRHLSITGNLTASTGRLFPSVSNCPNPSLTTAANPDTGYTFSGSGTVLRMCMEGGSLMVATVTITDWPKNALGTTSTPSLSTTNGTAATLGVPVQMTPAFAWVGRAWDTDDAVSRSVQFFAEALPTSGTTVAGTWKLGYTDPVSSAITYPLTVGSTGTVTALAAVSVPAGTVDTATLNFGTANTGLSGRGTSQIGFVSGGAGRVELDSSDLKMLSSGRFGFTSGGPNTALDTLFERESAAVFQLGSDAAGTTAYTLKANDRITSDGVGANFTAAGGRGRGGAGGSFIVQTAAAAGSGVAGTLTTRLTIDSTGLATFGDGTTFAPILTGYQVEANTGTKNVTTAESREVYTNTGDADGSTINLPNDPVIGTQFIVAVVAAQTITINTGSGESIFLAGTSCGTDITGNDTGASLLIVAVTGGSGAVWHAVGSGTWTC